MSGLDFPRTKCPPKAFPIPGHPLLQGSITIWIQSARPRKGPGKRKFSRPYCTARFYFGLRYPRSELRLAAVVLIPGRRSFSFNVDLFVVVAESRSHMMFLLLRPIFLDTAPFSWTHKIASGFPPRRGEAEEIFGAVSEDLSRGTGGTGKSIDKAGGTR